MQRVGKRCDSSFLLILAALTALLCAALLSQQVKRSAKEESRYPLMEEYDFKNDHRNPLLNMDLRPSTRIRVRISFPAPSFLMHS